MSISNHDRTDYVNPILGGVEIINAMFHEESKGTLGMIVKRGIQNFCLTALHVLIQPIDVNFLSENVNDYKGFYTNDFDDEKTGIITQPAIEGYRTGLVLKNNNYFDFANDAGLFLLKDRGVNDDQHINSFEGQFKYLAETQDLAKGIRVKKVGIGTGITYGEIEEISNNKILIKPDSRYGDDVSSGGDSGSIWVLNDKKKYLTAVGLHSVGMGNKAIAYHLKKIFTNLKINLL